MVTRFGFRKYSLKMYNVIYISSTRIEVNVMYVVIPSFRWLTILIRIDN